MLAITPDFLRSEALGDALGGALSLLQTKISPFVDPSCAKIGESGFRGKIFCETFGMLICNYPANYDDAFAAEFPGAAVGQP